MKLLLVFAICVVTSTSAMDAAFMKSFKQKAQKIGMQCIQETKASADDITVLLSHQIPESHEGKCMVFCFQTHLKIMKADGTIDTEGVESGLEIIKTADADLYEKLEKVFKSCSEKLTINEDPCLTAIDLMLCGKAEAEKLGITTDNIFNI